MNVFLNEFRNQAAAITFATLLLLFFLVALPACLWLDMRGFTTRVAMMEGAALGAVGMSFSIFLVCIAFAVGGILRQRPSVTSALPSG